MTVLATFALLLAGFAALALSMHRHHRDLLGGVPLRLRVILLRCAGWMLLAGALVVAIEDQGGSMSIVLWLGAATAAALAVAGTLSIFSTCVVSERKHRDDVGSIVGTFHRRGQGAGW
jgi:hypothetical protein